MRPAGICQSVCCIFAFGIAVLLFFYVTKEFVAFFTFGKEFV